MYVLRLCKCAGHVCVCALPLGSMGEQGGVCVSAERVSEEGV